MVDSMRKKKDRSGENLAFEPEEFYKMLSHLKRCFSRGKSCKEALKKVRSTEPRYKANGKLHKIPIVRYTCNHCNNKFPSTEVQCDHIDPVVPIQVPAIYMSLGVLARRIFISADKIQVLCKSCHNQKSQKENEERRQWLNKVKYIVYMTTNTVNNKFYIGVHKCIDLSDGYIGSGKILKKAIDKYGKDKFIREVLNVYTTEKEAYEEESRLVNETFIEVNENDSYNLSVGGKGSSTLGFMGKKHSESSKIKLREVLKKHRVVRKIICIQTKEVFDRIIDARKIYGDSVKYSLKTGGKVKGMYTFVYLENYTDNHPIKEKRTRGKKVLCVEKNKVYSSMRQAALDIGRKGNSSILKCCLGKIKKAHGYTYKFI